MKSQKRIAIDMSWLGPTGIGRVAEEIIARRPDNWEVVPVRKGCKNAGMFTPLDLAKEIGQCNADLFWSPGFMPPAWYGKTPVVLTIHDLTHLHFYKARHRIYYNAFIKPLVRKASALITVSDFSRKELMAWSGVPEDRVVRIYNGVSSDFSDEGGKISIGRPYILYVGNRREYKNVLGLMRAFAQSRLGRAGFALVLTGEPDESCRMVEQEQGLAGQVHYLGYVPEEKLPSLYRGAHALAFVSRYEGFGLPILEAMACGVPVLTSNVSSMPEIAGSAALLVDPSDIPQISDGLRKIALDEELRASLKQRGILRAKEFSWNKSGEHYWNTFDAVLKSQVALTARSLSDKAKS